MNYEFCYKHQMLRAAGEACGHCAASARRDDVNVLEARIADLEVEVIGLRRQLNATRQIALDAQRAVNDAAPLILSLLERPQ